MNTKFSISDSDLASRRSAVQLRADVESQLLAGICVELDLSAVESISESYADELFGVLIHHYSLPWVFSRLRLTGPKPAVVRSITQAIRYRLERSSESGPIECVVRDALQRHEEAFAA